MKIHYFQRYHSKENVATANTLLMLSRFYNFNADKFYTMLNELILHEDTVPEISFDLQVQSEGSVPDAIIQQKSFKIVVETKLYNQFREEQLKAHLNAMKEGDIKVLLTLDPRPMEQSLKDKIDAICLQSGAKHVNLTFESLIDSLQKNIDDRETELRAVLDDFREYCYEDGLLNDSSKYMRAIAASTTLKDNIELNLYYCGIGRNVSEHGYIGLYSNKSIRAIGKIYKTAISKIENGTINFYSEKKGSPLTDGELERLHLAVERSKAYGYNLGTWEHRFYLVEKFYEINFEKTTPNPIQRDKFFNLAIMLKQEKQSLPDTQEIAKFLDGKSWKDFDY